MVNKKDDFTMAKINTRLFSAITDQHCQDGEASTKIDQLCACAISWQYGHKDEITKQHLEVTSGVLVY